MIALRLMYIAQQSQFALQHRTRPDSLEIRYRTGPHGAHPLGDFSKAVPTATYLATVFQGVPLSRQFWQPLRWAFGGAGQTVLTTAARELGQSDDNEPPDI